MRFILDHNVDVRVRSMLQNCGHDCWTLDQMGMAEASDDEIAVVAHERDAVLISHDREFAAWRKRRTLGQHIRLKCDEASAFPVLESWLEEILAVLAHKPDVVIEVQREKFVTILGWE